MIRTDFSDDTTWEEICDEIREPQEHFSANLEFVNDAQYKNATRKQLLDLVPDDYAHSFLIVADRGSMTQPEHALVVIDLFGERGREFRAVPSQIQSIENNLSIANMGFEDFADAVDDDGIFRGFPET